MNELTDDSVLRALRQLPEVAPDEAFVTAVSLRIRAQRRQLLALYALLGIAALAAQVLPLLQSSLLMTLAACAAVITLLWTRRDA